jgi:hypothetical protein
MQDERLQPSKDQPDLSAFITVLLKVGRYGTNWSRIDFDVSSSFGASSIARLPTQGEMIGRIFLIVQMPDIYTIQQTAQTTKIGGVQPQFVGPRFGWTNSLGHSLINSVSLYIGGNLVDTIPGALMEILDEFQTPLEKVVESSRQLCRLDSGFTQTSFGNTSTSQQVAILLPFWFSRGDPGCFLPIDALNIDEVRLTIQFNPVTSLYYTDSRSSDSSVADSSGNLGDTTSEVTTSNCTRVNGDGRKGLVTGGALWPMASSPFYYADPSGAVVPGLEPDRFSGVKVSKYPDLAMPAGFSITDSYLLVEYIYLDKPEANRFRIADIQVPIVQHYTVDPVDNQGNKNVRIPLNIPNPTRDLFFFCQRREAPGYNAHFLATRDLSGVQWPSAPWWPDAKGLNERIPGALEPAFSTRYSEPLRWLALNYSETLNRFSTENVSLFRSLLPSLEQRKAPWVNRYFYNLPLGLQNGFTPFSMPMGEANLDKVKRLHLVLGFHGLTGIINDDFVNRYITHVFAETYNVFRVYGGRGAMMFAY